MAVGTRVLQRGEHDHRHEEVAPTSEPLISSGFEQVPISIHEEVKTPSPESLDFGGDTSGKCTLAELVSLCYVGLRYLSSDGP